MILEGKKHGEDFGTKMEQDSRGNQKLFYRVLETLRNPKQYNLRHIKDKHNQNITEPKKRQGGDSTLKSS
ncbi:unnamed protein product [Acanthoscelides obtectus]|uniref:Uncharacterized protein n=1 Tax=Acanthoscelides obtectus TaxID=200917 RepID=A0A9P0MME9_ACAOB|nr:unnamed protein product [Acanthoscelides obtectus]CAK1619992.1 hypothetical protein AOBTE_LOCUS117 [Acanthoscelides obtectus]